MSVMPPRKEPWSLYKTSIRYVLNLIGEACSTLEKRYGNYDQDKCCEQIVIFQEYLAYNLPSTILDELWDTRRFVTETNLKNDHRILTAVSMHRNMLKFIVNHESYKFKVCGDNSFWMTQLSRLNNLVVLDLYLACTDEILEVVGKCCPQLEQIDIVSKMEADHTYADGNNLFNALKIKFFVSDNGLLHLSKCKKLKVIYMNKMIRSQSAGRVVSKSGIRQLIKALPNIEFVSYNDMGLVIAQEMDDVRTLSLRRIIDQHPDISHIFAAARLCPKLDNLSLCFPTFENAVGSHVMILNALAESTINSTTLELIMFPIGDSFFSLLSVKGHLLYCLRLHCDNISAKLVCVIGQCCPGLKQLHLRETTVKMNGSRETIPSKQNLFYSLQCVYIWGNGWNPFTTLPILLTCAKQIKILNFQCASQYGCLDQLIAQVLGSNPMQELNNLFAGCFLSKETINHLFNCPRLRSFTFHKHSNITDDDVKELLDNVYSNNLEIELYAMNVYLHFYT